MKLPFIVVLSGLLLSTTAYAQGVNYNALSNDQLEAKCNDKDGQACYRLAEKLGNSKNKEDKQKSNDFMEKGCDAGFAYACGMFGDRYRKGTYGLAKSGEKALEYYKKGCELKHKGMCHAVGVMYFEGKSVPKSTEKAKEYLKKGCDLKNYLSCMGLKDLENRGL